MGIFETVKEMRRLQKLFFQTRNREVMFEAKKLEKKVDNFFKEYDAKEVDELVNFHVGIKLSEGEGF